MDRRFSAFLVASQQVWRSAATRWILLGLAAVALVGWTLELRPLAVQWGPVGLWVGGLATATGLILTAAQIRNATNERHEEAVRRRIDEEKQREAQARAVSVWSVADQSADGKWTVKYRIMNGGDYPVDNAVLVVADPGSPDCSPMQQLNTAGELVLGTLLPGEKLEDEFNHVHFSDEPSFGELTALVCVLFADTWAQSWARGPMLLEKLESPPRAC